MGNPVTVDSDDLESLLLAAELGARVQSDVMACTSDAAYKRRAPDMRESSDRVRTLRDRAIRPKDNPYEDRPPSQAEIRIMESIADDGGVMRVHSIVDYQDLISKGLVIGGTGNFIIKWGNKTQSGLTDTRQFVKLTQKGLEWLANHGRLPAIDRPPSANPPSSPTSVSLSEAAPTSWPSASTPASFAPSSAIKSA